MSETTLWGTPQAAVVIGEIAVGDLQVGIYQVCQHAMQERIRRFNHMDAYGIANHVRQNKGVETVLLPQGPSKGGDTGTVLLCKVDTDNGRIVIGTGLNISNTDLNGQPYFSDLQIAHIHTSEAMLREIGLRPTCS